MSKKIIFYLDNDLRQFCLSYYLQQKIDSEFFSIIDITDKPKKFFKEQKFVNFQKKWFLHDYTIPTNEIDFEYLKKFEEKYKINLWSLAINERLFYRFNEFYKFSRLEILSILEHECKLFEKILDEIKPDFAIMHEPFFHTDELFYRLCKSKGIKILMSYLSNFGYKWEISQVDHIIDNIDEFENIKSKGRTFEELQDIFNQTKINEQLEKTKNKKFGNTRNLIDGGLEFLIKTKNSNLKTHYTYFGRTKLKVILNTLNSSKKTRVRRKFIENNLAKKIDLQKKYVYFPLHIDQERTSLIETPFYTNQIEFVRNVVKALPIEMVLYVKEHPMQELRNWRNEEWYKEVINIPNVILIHPDVSSEELIRNSSLVITISGTAALQAAVFKKPSITFVDADYLKISSITRVKSFEDLADAIKTSIKKEIKPDDLDRYVSLKEKYAFDHNEMEFQESALDKFYHGGRLVDVEILNKDMENFLIERKDNLEEFTNQHIKKLHI